MFCINFLSNQYSKTKLRKICSVLFIKKINSPKRKPFGSYIFVSLTPAISVKSDLYTHVRKKSHLKYKFIPEKKRVIKR